MPFCPTGSPKNLGWGGVGCVKAGAATLCVLWILSQPGTIHSNIVQPSHGVPKSSDHTPLADKHIHKHTHTCGCGQLSLAAISSSAPSMTAAPLSMVAIRMSWPGQSTKDTCLISCMGPAHWSQGGASSCTVQWGRERGGRWGGGEGRRGVSFGDTRLRLVAAWCRQHTSHRRQGLPAHWSQASGVASTLVTIQPMPQCRLSVRGLALHLTGEGL